MLPVIAQKEMRTILLETKEKEIRVIYYKILAEVCPVVRWKAELLSDRDLLYLAKEISKQTVQGAAYGEPAGWGKGP